VSNSATQRAQIVEIDAGSMTDDAFVDAHVHFWDHSVPGLTWAWLDPGFDHPRLKGTPRLDAPRYTTPEFLGESAGTGVVAAVHVQAAAWSERPERETEWLESVAADTGWPQALVGNIRLAATDAAQVVKAHRESSARVRGVRDLAIPVARLDEPDVVERFAAVAPLAGTVELMTTYEEFPKLAGLANRAPDSVLVLGHAGLPLERTPAYRTNWLRALHRLADTPNVVCKISALASAADPDWTVESLRPWVLGCVEAFGPGRCMLATNWPIDRLFGNYVRLVDSYREILAPLAPDERAALFHGTAERVYAIKPAP
jgi:predicted TIM-barrel fold metal-dependent hydrolase